MRVISRALALGLLLTVALTRVGAAEPSADEKARAETASRLSRALDEAIADRGRELVRLEADWVNSEPGARQVTVVGSGVGTWGRERQFRLPPELVAKLLQMLKSAEFLTMPPSFGGTAPAKSKEPLSAGVRLNGSVTLSIGAVGFSVMQFHRGHQSKELKALALGILDACKAVGERGVKAPSLDSGLAMLSNGALALEGLELRFHERVFDASARPATHGWMLTVMGRHAELRVYDDVSGYAAPVFQYLSPETAQTFVAALVQAKVEGLPINLYSELYRELHVRVLGHQIDVVAQQFAGKDHNTLGARQVSFDKLAAAIGALREALAPAGARSPTPAAAAPGR